ncbi:MAG: cyclase family protein [Dehalococcoides mccartyi]|uniref:cyclase family protein n=1 Tax=Dehalococcoides mccartyi TaxID=61435 RepID=UPI0025C8244E|nr:cyclase family protein [Dehalococcoides mccartyi]MDN4185781.1 cyclase family protein [Dehalococcoides mccartyi]
MKKIYDLSPEIRPEMISWPGDDPPQIKLLHSIRGGFPTNLGQLTMTLHNGSHIDAPLHFFEDGDGADEIPLEILIGNVRVLSLSGVKTITRDMLEQAELKGVTRLILATDNEALWDKPDFDRNYTYIDIGAARYLTEIGVRLLGIDYLSVEDFEETQGVHKHLLSRGVVILESLQLAGVAEGDYELFCLPLKLGKVDGAPARVILIER